MEGARERASREQEEAASDWFLSWLCPTLSAISAIVRTRRGLPAAAAAAAAAATASCGEATTAGAATRRRPPIGGCRPQGAALITRPCSTVSLYCTRLESTLPCIGASDVCIPTHYIYACIYRYIHIWTYKRLYWHTYIFHVCVRVACSLTYVYAYARKRERTRVSGVPSRVRARERAHRGVRNRM